MVCTGSDNVLPCPSSGDPRFARMTEEAAILPRPLLGGCPCVGDCVVAKSARLRFRLAAKASPAPLLLLFGRDPLRWVRVRGGVLRTPLNDGDFGRSASTDAPRCAPQFLHVIQSLRKQAKNPPVGSTKVATTALKILLSFSRFARESPRWFVQVTMTYCHAPPRGIPASRG